MVQIHGGARDFSLPKHPDWLWTPPSHLYSGYWRMSGAISPLPLYTYHHGMYKDNFAFFVYLKQRMRMSVWFRIGISGGLL
jgi:hypothetical protein